MEARAVSRFTRVSPRKARLVADLIRGKNIEDALAILALTPKKASPILRKAVLSATANVRDREVPRQDRRTHPARSDPTPTPVHPPCNPPEEQGSVNRR